MSRKLDQVLASMTTEERVALAKQKTERAVDHLLYLLQLNATNEIVVYSSALSSQIPTSYAANAFNAFVGALGRFEIVRLCALWDRPEIDKENIPIIVELVDNRDAIEALVEETRSHWGQKGGHLFTSEDDDPSLAVVGAAEWAAIDKQFGEEEAIRARSDLQTAIDDARAILESKHLTEVMNFRDKHLAHSLFQTRRERVCPVDPMKADDAHQILAKSCNIVEVLHRVVNGKSFSFDDARRIHRENADALWAGCKFNIAR